MKRFLPSLLAITLLLSALPLTRLEPLAATDDLIWPCESSYYVTCMYYYKTGGQHSTRYGYDKSMDLAGGGNIVAAEGGVVETATDLGNTSFGRYVVIKHASGYRTLYAHLDSFTVSVGQSVAKGEKIGVMGTTGNSSGVHLHFEYSGGDPWKMFYNEKYSSKLSFEQNVRSNNDKFNADKTIVNAIDSFYYKSGTDYFYAGPTSDNENCTCSASVSGLYICKSSSATVRSGHGEGFDAVGTIPSGATVTVFAASDEWAHIKYESITGYVPMNTLERRKCTVSFDANGGSGTMADVKNVLGKYSLPACKFKAPAGKEFRAWKVGNREYIVGARIDISVDTVVVAMWKDVETVKMLGDVNADGKIDQYDYLLVKRDHFGTRKLSTDEKKRADVNKDGKVDTYDYLLIARHYFGTYVIK